MSGCAWRRGIGIAALALGVAGPARADSAADAAAGRDYGWLASEVAVRSEVTPSVVRLGERATYRARVVAPRGFRVEWGEPERAPDLTWGSPVHRTRSGSLPKRRQGGERARPGSRTFVMDTTWCEIPLQAFEPGRRVLAGLPFTVVERVGGGPALGPSRVPQVALDVVLTLSPADSNAQLHDLHGPLAAPWWERVPWRWVIGALLAMVLAYGLWRLLRRRRPAAPPVVVPATARDPRAEALEALATLRKERLPEAGRFAEHAFRLGRILRTYLERVVPVTRPGDTTPELVAHLAAAGTEAEELRRLSALLRAWDRVKFAREPLAADEAHRGEDAVEHAIRREWAPSVDAATRAASGAQGAVA